MSSINHDCRRIEHVLGRMLKGARVGCMWQMDTRDYLVTVEMRQRIRTFRLTAAESVRPNWQNLLVDEINEWFSGKVAI
jgi:hypothetical protein